MSSVIEIFADIEWELLSADDETGTVDELGFKNILARVSKEGGALVVVVETSAAAVRRFSSSSPLGVELGMEVGGDDERLGEDPE